MINNKDSINKDNTNKDNTSNNEFFKQINFPYPNVRKGQDEFIKKVYDTISQNKNLIVCAPTGLGKTVSGIAPALHFAKKNKLSVIVLTSRQTQANQVIKTIKDISLKIKDDPNIKEKDKQLNYLAFIGKRNMCVHPERDLYPSSDFNDFCKKMKETGRCKFFKNTKNTDYDEQIKGLLELSSKEFMTVESFVDLSYTNNFCPYELVSKKAYLADVIICDYNYMFSPGIREGFLGKIGRELDECIIIVDEAHNLPDRIRNSHSHKLTSEMIKNALKELSDFVKSKEYDSYIHNFSATIDELYFNKILGEKTETLVEKDEILSKYLAKFNKLIKYQTIIDDLRNVEKIVKEDRIISHIGRFANFLEKWATLNEESYLRILEKNVTKDKTVLSLTIKCIDPSEISEIILNNSYSTLLMSATLSPIEMYKDILGLKKVEMLELESPFSKKNQLTLVINDVTTKYTNRSSDMFIKIADHIQRTLNSAEDKNAIVFFPSYDLMERIVEKIKINKLNRKILKEQKYMTKEEKEKYIDKFKQADAFSGNAKVLFAVTSGSFAEGLDLPREMLEMVIVVGLPLGVPDLTTNAVIAHYDKKFKKGQMYGYINPALNKIIQAAGRCIRTEEDRGAVVLIDSRFLWSVYAQNFPKHWKLTKAGENYNIDIGNFFDDKDPMSF